MKLTKCNLLMCAAWGSLAMAGTANAQEAAPESGISDEIIVTANKREQNLNDVGLTITAVSGKALAERKVTSLEDIASIVPGLSFAASSTNTPIFTLRGIGFNESSLGVYPAVSIYVDQAPLPFPVLASHSAFDLERVEVLKGPQGTLFGQNSTGGAINYIAAKPTDTFRAGGDIGFGRFNAIEGNVYVSGPITDNLNARIAVTGQNSDGWQHSATRPNDRNGASSYVAGRLLLDYKPTDTIKLGLNVNGWIDKSEPQAMQLIAVNPADPTTDSAYAQALSVFSHGSPRIADWTGMATDPATGVVNPDGTVVPGTSSQTDFTPRSERKFYQIALRADVELGADIALTSLTSYGHYDQTQATDGDGNALVSADLQKNDGYIRTFSQELRLANEGKSQLRWMLGANFERSTTFEDQLLRYFDNSNYGPPLHYINASDVTNKQTITNYAFFASAEYDVLENLTAKAAVRYTNSKIANANCGFTIEGGNTNVVFGLADPAACYTFDANFKNGSPILNTLKEDNVSWRVGLDYRLDDDTLVYANVSRGYKAGSYPSLAAATYASLKPVTQESVTTYEIGLKTEFADRRVGLNIAAFYNDYRNKQIRGKLIETPNIFGPLDTLANVPKSRILGAEAELTLRPIEGLTLTGAVTYLDSKVLRGPVSPYNYNVLGQADTFQDDRLPFTPKWSGVVNLDYRYKLADGGTPFIGVATSSRSATDSVIGGSRLVLPVRLNTLAAPGITYVYANKGYTTVDGRIGYESADESWRVMLWAKNIFNTYYWNAVTTANESAARVAGKPATYGVTFGFKLR